MNVNPTTEIIMLNVTCSQKAHVSTRQEGSHLQAGKKGLQPPIYGLFCFVVLMAAWADQDLGHSIRKNELLLMYLYLRRRLKIHKPKIDKPKKNFFFVWNRRHSTIGWILFLVEVKSVSAWKIHDPEKVIFNEYLWAMSFLIRAVQVFWSLPLRLACDFYQKTSESKRRKWTWYTVV